MAARTGTRLTALLAGIAAMGLLFILAAMPPEAGAAPAASDASVAKDILRASSKPTRVVRRVPCLVGRRKAHLVKNPSRLPCGASGGEARGDFNGDGIGDLAVGAPSEDFPIGRASDQGAVHVLYGAAGGLATTGSQFFDQAAVSTQVSQARFGSALASGDYDGDGFGDLAIGAPGTSIASGTTSFRQAVGEVAIIFGSPSGLDPKRKQVIDPGVAGRTGFSDNANFGAALVWGQFGGGPEADLAIGAPGDREQGTVTTLLGGPGGLDLASFQRFTLGGIFGLEVRENFMRFGDSLTGGDFDGDRFADIAIGAPSLSLAPPPARPERTSGARRCRTRAGLPSCADRRRVRPPTALRSSARAAKASKRRRRPTSSSARR